MLHARYYPLCLRMAMALKRNKMQTVKKLVLAFLASISLSLSLAAGQEGIAAWEPEVRDYVARKEWTSAMQVIDRELGASPNDENAKAWRARILTWSGQLIAAEQEYRWLIAADPHDPDNYLGLGAVYVAQGRSEDAIATLGKAVTLDPQRADLRVALGRAFWSEGRRTEAKLEFVRALKLSPSSVEAQTAMAEREDEPRHYLSIAMNTDLFSFADANHDGGIALTSRWSPHWQTYLGANDYHLGDANAQKAIASVAAKTSSLGAITIGGSGARDNGIVPKAEAFFEYDKGWRLSRRGLARGLEMVYTQHWYWYRTARILSIGELALFYLPNEWTWSLRVSGARSQFYGSGTEWRPSGMTKLGFPIARPKKRQLNGSTFFAAGTETFGRIDQIGSFASQTFGGSLSLELTRRQDVSGYAAYQKRTDNRSETSFGFSYGVHF
jgi:tetratricopeptide (TPR) repeat protein